MGAGEKAGPFESENWVSKVRELQLVHGAHRPLGFGRYRGSVGIYSGCSFPMTDAGDKAGPLENENFVSNVWEFQLLHVTHRPLGFVRYRGSLGIYSGGSVPMSY